MTTHFTQLLQEYSSQLNLSIAQLIYNALPADCSDLSDDELAQTLINYVEMVFPHRINQTSTTIDYSSVDQFLIDYHKPTDQILVNCCWLQTQLKEYAEARSIVNKQAKALSNINHRIDNLRTLTKTQPTPPHKTLNVYS